MSKVNSSFICAVKKLLEQGKVTKRHLLPWILCLSREALAETKPKAKIKTGNMVRDKNLDLQWEVGVKEVDKDSYTEDRFLPKGFFNWTMAESLACNKFEG